MTSAAAARPYALGLWRHKSRSVAHGTDLLFRGSVTFDQSLGEVLPGTYPTMVHLRRRGGTVGLHIMTLRVRLPVGTQDLLFLSVGRKTGRVQVRKRVLGHYRTHGYYIIDQIRSRLLLAPAHTLEWSLPELSWHIQNGESARMEIGLQRKRTVRRVGHLLVSEYVGSGLTLSASDDHQDGGIAPHHFLRETITLSPSVGAVPVGARVA